MLRIVRNKSGRAYEISLGVKKNGCPGRGIWVLSEDDVVVFGAKGGRGAPFYKK